MSTSRHHHSRRLHLYGESLASRLPADCVEPYGASPLAPPFYIVLYGEIRFTCPSPLVCLSCLVGVSIFNRTQPTHCGIKNTEVDPFGIVPAYQELSPEIREYNEW